MKISFHETYERDYLSFATFRKHHPNATVDCINDRDFHAACEGCGAPLLEGDRAYRYDEGVLSCADCGGETGQDVEVLGSTT